MTNLYELEWENIHSHSHYSNIMTPDSVIKTEDLAKRAVAMGQKTISTVEHGYFGSIFDYYETAQEYGLKLIFGIEYYFVKDRFEKDRTNSHLLVVAKNEEGRREMTSIMSEANKTGFFYHPRIDEELLFSLTPENVIVTTACLSSPLNSYSEDEAMRFLSKAKEHFGDNFYIEVQPHTNIKQVEFQRKILKYNRKFNFPLILGVDSHYIKLEDDETRDLFLKGKNIYYPAEDGFTMDYPDITDIVKRLKLQGVLTDAQIEEAITNTLVVRDFEGVSLNKEIKMPSLYPDKSHEEKMVILKELINEKWREDRKEIPEEKWGEYIEAIREEIEIVEETKMEDYFLLNHAIIEKAVNEYDGVITSTGRGCFEESAIVHTKDSMKLIKDVEVGDYVINRYGEFDKVLNTWEYEIEEELVSIDYLYGQGKHFPVNATKDHKILIMNGGRVEYKEAGRIKKGDYVCLPKIKNNKKDHIVIDLNDYNQYGFRYDDTYIYEEYEGINSKHNKKVRRHIVLDETFNEFFGLMYGDGNTTNKRGNMNSVELSVNTKTHKNTHNRRIFEKVASRLSLNCTESIAKEKNLSTLSLNSKVFATFFNKNIFESKKGKEKEFNSSLFNQSEECLSALYRGLLNSDGHIDSENNRFSFDNTSKSILNAFKILGIMTNKNPVGIVYRASHTDRRGFNSVDSFKLRGRIGSSESHKRIDTWHEDNNYYYLPVRSVRTLPKKITKVYDLQVENDPSFLINNMVVHNSAPSFYINKLLGLTDIDRVSAPITLYPTRFMSKSRILETKSMPDIDFNLADPEPFRKASKDLMGEDNSEWMVAYGTMQESSAFKNYARSVGIDFNEANQVSDDLDRYKNDKRWGEVIEASSVFRGVIDSVAPHPCSHLLLPRANTSETTGTIKVKDEFVTLITSNESDNYKYLKND